MGWQLDLGNQGIRQSGNKDQEFPPAGWHDVLSACLFRFWDYEGCTTNIPAGGLALAVRSLPQG